MDVVAGLGGNTVITSWFVFFYAHEFLRGVRGEMRPSDSPLVVFMSRGVYVIRRVLIPMFHITLCPS